MDKILLVTPPFVQVNAPYPATAYLKGYLTRQGIPAEQYDLSIELIGEIFSATFLRDVFDGCDPTRFADDPNLVRIHALRGRYLATVGPVLTFLRGQDPTLAGLICGAEFLPQAGRFETLADLDAAFGSMGQVDCAKYLCTLYLQDIADFLRATVSEHFEIVKYAERIALSIPDFAPLAEELARPLNRIEKRMTELLHERIERERPRFVSFTVPFPGNLYSALRCAQYIKRVFPEISTILGGGYPSTELRNLTDRALFDYFDYVSLDDGELALERIVTGGEPIRTFTREGYHEGGGRISHRERGCPDFGGLPHDRYFSLCEVTNPMHRLWSDGRWNKMMLAHGCYWSQCAFCDTSLDYIGRFDAASAGQIADWMEQVAAQTGSRGFHFVDEAAPPRLLKELSLELLRRGAKFSWWTNIRFEAAYTGDLCQLMAAAGCIAVSGGLEVASDRLLAMINKGITIGQATLAMRNFFYAGIMVHTYLMYGLPTQTLQESVDSLEVVRQMFRAQLIDSAFWHRYAMTLHSPSGREPEKFGVRRKGTGLNPFANNEIYFAENRGYNINLVGDGLREALAYYMAGEGLERPVHKWFAGKVPPTTVEPTLITDHLIRPDACRIFDEKARLVWIGSPLRRTEEGIEAYGPAGQKRMKLPDADADFLMRITALCGDLNATVTFADVQKIYAEYGSEPFAILYHSKKWDTLRGFGLLQI